jgi:hypothetical protein
MSRKSQQTESKPVSEAHDRAAASQAIEPGTWPVPGKVWIDRDEVRSDWHVTKRVEAPPDLLDRLVRLAKTTSTDQEVAAFCANYGLILLCREHDRPVGHLRDLDDPEDPYPCVIPGDDTTYTSVGWLRNFARQCSAILNIAQRLQSTGPDRGAGTREDWLVLDPDYAQRDGMTFDMHWQQRELTLEERIEEDNEHLSEIVDHWLDIANVRLRVRINWTDYTPSLALGPTTLHGALVTSLATSIARGELAVCTACGRAYTPKRRTSPGRRNYCDDPDCKKARQAHAQRDHAARTNQKVENK